MKKIIPILIIILFSSCDPGVINKFVIENKTESDIKVITKLKPGKRKIYENDSIHLIKLKPQSELLIVEYGEIGNAHDKDINFLEGIDTIIVQKENSTLNINIFDRYNWTYEVIKKGLFTMDEVEYKLTLTENNFR